MLISRRGFLKLVGSALVAGIPIPAFSEGRGPYVLVGEVVGYIGHSPGGFCGGQLVANVGEWDGVGYPVKCWNSSYGPARKLEDYYDFDLANFGRDVPKDFWHHRENVRRYPNVHAYLREQRFGETLADAMKHLNHVSFHNLV